MQFEGRIVGIENGKITIKTDKGSVVVYGTLPENLKGMKIQANVEFKGGKFFLKSHHLQVDKEYVINYLKSIKGIGQKTAEKLYSEYGEEIINLAKDKDFLSNHVKRKVEIDNSLDGYERIYGILRKELGEVRTKKALEFIKKNWSEFIEDPYTLLSQHGFGFKTVDPIALEFIEKDSPVRISAYIEYILEKQAQSGHTWIDLENLKTLMRKELGTDKVVLRDSTQIDGNRVYLKKYRDTEEYIASTLLDNNIIEPLGKANKIPDHLTEKQVKAVEMALTHRTLIISGYAGTGKTTVAKTIIQELESKGMDVLLLAPTGKASKRLEEATGRTASTIHRSLYYGMRADAYIVDESSMIGVELAKELLKYANGSRIVFLGDTAQLPPVDTGHFFRDVIKSGEIPVVFLDEIMRNAGGIVRNASLVREGKFPKKQDDNFYWITDKPLEYVEKLLKKAKEKGVEVQLLGGIYKGQLGVDNLNKIAQEILNPDGKEYHGYRIGDKVIHTGNNDYTNFVMNGDSGIIVDGNENYLTVKFWDGKEKVYPKSELKNLSLSYALTVHKAQGSEWQNVAVVFDTASYTLLSRYWLYTAITRAKDRCFLVAETKPVAIAVKNSAYPERNTFLQDFLHKSNCNALKNGI